MQEFQSRLKIRISGNIEQNQSPLKTVSSEHMAMEAELMTPPSPSTSSLEMVEYFCTLVTDEEDLTYYFYLSFRKIWVSK